MTKNFSFWQIYRLNMHAVVLFRMVQLIHKDERGAESGKSMQMAARQRNDASLPG